MNSTTLTKKTKDDIELEEFLQASADDIFKELGPISKEEYDYYMSLPNKSK
jgi:hypothetical protein